MYLLTGGTGTLGVELQKHLDCCPISSKDWDITDGAPLFFYNRYQKNLSNVDTIIHAGAYTDVPESEINKMQVIETNIFGTKYVKDLALVMSAKMIYISTDYVYPGEHGNYKEDDMTRPVNFYGFTKLAGEAFLDPDKDLIVRTSFKPNDLWNTKLDKAFIDIYTSADYVGIVAKDIVLAIENNLTGIINIGTEKKSIYDLAVRRNPNVGKITKHEINCPMPRDVSMNIDKFNEFKRSLEK